MAKNKSSYVCQGCGAHFGKWSGQCSDCGEWNSLVEEKIQKTSDGIFEKDEKKKINKPTALNTVEGKETFRTSTGFEELDRVLGGGIVKGSLVLVGGEPGIGKSTLILQLCDKIQSERKGSLCFWRGICRTNKNTCR